MLPYPVHFSTHNAHDRKRLQTFLIAVTTSSVIMYLIAFIKICGLFPPIYFLCVCLNACELNPSVIVASTFFCWAIPAPNPKFSMRNMKHFCWVTLSQILCSFQLTTFQYKSCLWFLFQKAGCLGVGLFAYMWMRSEVLLLNKHFHLLNIFVLFIYFSISTLFGLYSDYYIMFPVHNRNLFTFYCLKYIH